MARNLVPRVPLLLALSTLNDEALHLLVNGIKSAATTSKLVANNPAMATSVTALGTKDGALTTAGKTVADDKAKLHTDIAAEAVCRTDLLGELRTYANFVAAGAQVPADVHGAGLTSRDQVVPNLPPAIPDLFYVKVPKKGHGKAVIGVHETGPIHYQYVAEESSDGVTWAPLGLGRGKTRTLTGATGTKIWVHFAAVRRGLQSPWSVAQLVTIP